MINFTKTKKLALFATVAVFFHFLPKLVNSSSSHKYSAEMNAPVSEDKDTFRMKKLNLLWEKARKRLPEYKLKNLYSELKVQDKEEITWKRMKSEGQDKEGLKEAELHKKLNSLINKYGLADSFKTREDNEVSNEKITGDMTDDFLKNFMFKDKKLAKLWAKAEKIGFTDEELHSLKEEFQHHQEKIDQYYILMDTVNQEQDQNDEKLNLIEAEDLPFSKKAHVSSHQLLKEKHKELKQGYDYLTKKVINDPGAGQFEESRVQHLWNLALKSNFTSFDLESLKEELHHYEHRIRKLNYMKSELETPRDIHGSNKYAYDDPDDKIHINQKVKEYEYKVNKIHNELESRLMKKHIEL